MSGVEPVAAGSAESLPRLSLAGRMRLTLEVIRTYGIVRWRLARTGLRETVGAVRQWSPGRPPLDGPRLEYWQGIRLGKATAHVLRLVPGDSRCLVQSLVLMGLLARRGIDSNLIVAVRSDPRFEAHAWVEHDRQPLLPAWDSGRLLEL